MAITVKDLTYYYDDNTVPTVNKSNFCIKDNETVAFLGVSGSGKTTLFNLIAGFKRPTSGKIIYDNTSLYELSYIRQSAKDMIFPWKTVKSNIEFALKERDEFNDKNKQRVNKLLDILNLEHRANYYPNDLSGGERKRLSFACGLSYSPKTVLLDEAFTGVDVSLKWELWSFLRNELERLQATALLITHSFDEAIYLADRILFIDKQGKVDSREVVIDSRLKNQYNKIENFFSDKEIVSVKEEALRIFREINDHA